MATPKVVWKEPGVAYKGGSDRNKNKYAELHQALRKNPGRWALVLSGPKHRTLSPSFRAKDIERAYRTRRVGGRKVYEAYARYTGK